MSDVSEFKPHRKGSGYNTQSCCPELAFRPCAERLIRGQETSLQHDPGLTLGVKRAEEKKVKPSQQLRGNTVRCLRDLENCTGEAESYGV